MIRCFGKLGHMTFSSFKAQCQELFPNYNITVCMNTLLFVLISLKEAAERMPLVLRNQVRHRIVDEHFQQHPRSSTYDIANTTIEARRVVRKVFSRDSVRKIVIQDLKFVRSLI
ncbi:unnamed protein product [Sphagnum tenellum]